MIGVNTVMYSSDKHVTGRHERYHERKSDLDTNLVYYIGEPMYYLGKLRAFTGYYQCVSTFIGMNSYTTQVSA